MSQTSSAEPVPQRVTHAAIAQRMGISRSAVTEALHRSRKSNLRPELQRQIQEVARQMSYRPRNVTTHTIGVLLSAGQLLNPADTLTFAVLERAITRRGYRLAMINPAGPASLQLSDMVNRSTVDGLILTSWGDGSLRAALPPDVPCLLMSEEEAPDIDVDQVGFDLVGMLANLFRHFREHGHERLCLVAGRPERGYYERLQHAAERARELVGLNAAQLQLVQTLPKATVAAVMPLLGGPNAPTGIICAANYHLFPLYCALFAAGYKIPHDISIAALVDDPFYQAVDPTITATDAIGPELADAVADQLIARMDDPASAPARRFIAGQVIARTSVGPCRATGSAGGPNAKEGLR